MSKRSVIVYFSFVRKWVKIRAETANQYPILIFLIKSTVQGLTVTQMVNIK
jgi:hypothetical protein